MRSGRFESQARLLLWLTELPLTLREAQAVYTLACRPTVKIRPEIRHAAGLALPPLKGLTIGGGTYVNEGDVPSPAGRKDTLAATTTISSKSIAKDYSMRYYTSA